MKKKKKKNLKFYFSLLLILILVSLAGAGGYIYYNLSNLSKKSTNSEKILKPIEVNKKTDSVNILVMGVDIGTVGSKNASDPKRTDTMILMHYNPKEKKATLVSIPRDTMVRIDGKRQKINAAHAISGVKGAIDAVQELLNTTVNYYAKVDYSGFREVIDSMGGIDMKINNKMDYDDDTQNLHIHFKKGETVHLDGKKAEEFFRWRKNNDGTGLAEGDIGRIQNQHIFIQKVIQKLKSPTNIPKIPGIVSTITKYVETNMDADSILAYGYDMLKIDKDNIKTYTLQGAPKYVGGISYFVYDKNKNKEVLSELRKNDTDNSNVADKSSLKVSILNGTGVNGLAKKVGEKVKSEGYSDIEVGNTKKTKTSKIILYGIDADKVDSIKQNLNIDNVQTNSRGESKVDIKIIIGKDYLNK